MPRPTNTKEWPNTSHVSINIYENDIVEFFTANDKGCIATNKRAYKNYLATVIFGKTEMAENKIEVCPGSRIWEVEINEFGTSSSLGKEMKNKKILVIIHSK
jgi:hypothetical protein